MAGLALTCGLAGLLSVLAYGLFDRFTLHEQSAERRAVEARAAELTARSLMPGSALGCLDAVASSVVESACERPLFASPESIAAAVGYVDARFSLLGASVAVAERDPTYQPVVDRLRRGLEADRYGLVAHVLMTRGCSGSECAELRLLHDPARVVANMKSHAFESSLGTHALAWQSGGTGPALASAPPVATPATAVATTGTGTPVAAAAAGATASAKFDFPSANSIPVVNIMNPEPGAPPAATEPRSAPPPSKRAAAASRRQAAAPAQAAPTPAPPAPPTQIAPEAVEMELVPNIPPPGPYTHTTR